MARRTLLAPLTLGMLCVIGCGSTPESPAPTPTTPSQPDPPPAPPARFIPANATVRVPVGEERGVVGTDVVVRVDHPVHDEAAHTCSVHVVARAGAEVRDETLTCDHVIVFHALTITVDGEGLWTSDGLVEVTLASDALSPPATTDCETDADCALTTFACCGPARCDAYAENVDVLRQHTDLCAHRICRPYEARPCGAQPVPPPSPRAACVDQVCEVVL
jgi:hypothetical protein